MAGAQGVLGRFTARALAAAGHNVLRGGRRAEEAADFRLVDLERPQTLAAALDGVDLVVTSIPDPLARLEREVLRRGGLLLSQASVPAPALRLLQADAAEGAKGTVVVNSGLTGVIGLVARDLLRQFPQADGVEIGFIISLNGSAGLAGVATAHSWLTSAPRLATVRRQFTPPRGLWSCFDLSLNDIVWMSPALTGARKVRAYMGMAEKGLAAFLRALNKLGLLKRLPVGLLAAPVRSRPPPKELTHEPIRMRTAVYERGQLLAARGVDAEGDYNSTVLSTAIFAGALLNRLGPGDLPAGLFFVEDLFQLGDMKACLDKEQIVVQPLLD
ncbi:MAG: hypothetical protein ACHP7N_03035 [Caulobacterales bacterium]